MCVPAYACAVCARVVCAVRVCLLPGRAVPGVSSSAVGVQLIRVWKGGAPQLLSGSAGPSLERGVRCSRCRNCSVPVSAGEMGRVCFGVKCRACCRVKAYVPAGVIVLSASTLPRLCLPERDAPGRLPFRRTCICVMCVLPDEQERVCLCAG